MVSPIIEEFKTKAGHIIENFRAETRKVRTGRPTPVLVEDIKVNYYEKPTPLKQLASISITPPREINIQVWDKAAVPNVAKAIETSSLGLSASVDGNIIRVHLPELSEERRQELIKHVKHSAEEHRIQLRHLRDETNKKIEHSFKEGEMNEDQKFKLKEAVQKQVDQMNDSVEEALEAKIKEINE